MKPGTERLEALAYHLAERGGRLFPLEEPAFNTQFPKAWPAVELSLAVRRNVLLIASEALHNAARHAGARAVTLGLEPVGSKRWCLWLKDDGCGMRNGKTSSNGSGMGIESMRRRAAQIGAEISWRQHNGSGTTVLITFDPQANDRAVK